MYKRCIYVIIAAVAWSPFGDRLIAAENGVPPSATIPKPVVAATGPESASASPPVLPSSKAEASTTSNPPVEPLPGRVEELKPTLFYLPDKEGRLQAVFDFGYEEFVELYKLKRQLEQKEQRPRYTLEKLIAAGKEEEGRAELTVRLQVALHDADWVRIPLRFDQGLLLKPAEYKGNGDFIVQYLGGGEGYAAWLHGPTDSPHEIEMRLAVPIATAGSEHKLKLYLPRAAISEFTLSVAENQVTAQGSEGAAILPPVASPSGGAEIAARGASGDFELSWRKSGNANGPTPAVIEAVGSILARLDDRGVSSEAALTVRSYGAPFDRFTVRLPEGAELTPANNAGYALALLEEGQSSADRGRLVEVRLPKKVLGPVEVHLSCRRQGEAKEPAAWRELSGFEVLGAARQWGVLAATASGDWQILWGASRGVRQIDQLPENLRVSGLAAGFEYFAQPFAIQTRLIPRRTRINVEPEYLLIVDRDRVRLDAKLTYAIHGGKAHALRIAMPDWQLDRVEPENLVAAEGLESDAKGILTIPLIEPASGTLELRLKAQRPIPAAAAAIAVGLPQPQETASVSAVVAVSPADNVELTPDGNASLGLIRQQNALPLKLPERRQEPLFYRSEGKAAIFAAEMRVHPRRIAVEMTDRVQLGDRSAEVEQKFAYAIDYEAVDHLSVDVPQSIANTATLAIERDGKPLSFRTIAAGEVPPAPAGMSRVRISLPEACLGRCTITARYALPLSALQTVKPALETIPLIVPAEGEALGNKLLLTAGGGIKASPVGNTWQLAEKEPVRSGRQSPQSYKAEGRIDRVEVEIDREETSGVNATVVERAWIQTWLTSSARQDRAAFQLLTNQSELTVALPPEAALSQMAALLDGKRLEVRPMGNDRVSIPLSSGGELRRYALEIIYHFGESAPVATRLKLVFPQIDSGNWTRRLYWQLILPQDKHILADPRGFAGEYRWGFPGIFWERRPLLSQEELETWVGTAHRTGPSEGLNVYLFSALGTVEGAETWTASRAWIVLLSSGTALSVGLLLIYFPALRHPIAILVLAFGLLSLGLIYPEPATVLAQASSIGLVLALITGLSVRIFPPRKKRKSEPPAARAEIPSTKSPQLVPASAVSVATTQNLPTLLE
ncbi:MAG: MerC domain-containing protein [Pirellulales bacterium]|nr:MerC domain-containing protein [Pirellulales bacterium]